MYCLRFRLQMMKRKQNISDMIKDINDTLKVCMKDPLYI
jgi:hypothetical protein